MQKGVGGRCELADDRCGWTRLDWSVDVTRFVAAAMTWCLGADGCDKSLGELSMAPGMLFVWCAVGASQSNWRRAFTVKSDEESQIGAGHDDTYICEFVM